jgi:glycosyltransferase involved in cell wall biosynthesis
MKILQVIPYFVPAWAYGGPVPVAYQISKELVKRGHEVVVYTTDTLDQKARQKTGYLETEGIKIYYFRNISNSLAWKRFFLSPGIMPRISKEIKTFDVIHLHEFRTFHNIAVHHYAKKYSIPYVLHAHGSVATYFQKGTLKRIFDRLWGYKILRDATKVIAVTPMEAEQYKSMGVSERRIEIVPNGIDLAEFDDLPQRGGFRKKYDLDYNQKMILYLGRIHKIKGLDVLAKAFADLSKELNNVKLVIAGPDDGYLPALKQLIKKLQIEEKVLLPGPLYGEEKLKAYVDADVYVLPSIYETFPVGVLESCACGTPVIVTDRCGIADVIDGQAGLVVPYDKDQLSSAILRMIGDEKARCEFAKRGKSLVGEQFTWEKIAKQLESIYESCRLLRH